MKTAWVIGVVGASGGVGASVLTAAIGVRAAQRVLCPVCVDGDRLGGGLDVTFGIEQEHGARWPDLARDRGRVEGSELLRCLPSVQGVSVLSFDRARDVRLDEQTATGMLGALRDTVEVVVVDLPLPDHELFAALAPSVAVMLLLAGSGIRDLAGASAITQHLVGACPGVWLALRTKGKGGHFADSVAGALDLPLLAVVREESSLAAEVLDAIPPGTSAGSALAAAADAVLGRYVAGSRPHALLAVLGLRRQVLPSRSPARDWRIVWLWRQSAVLIQDEPSAAWLTAVARLLMSVLRRRAHLVGSG